jgi:PAS domain S-box-containing protein
VVVNSVDRYMTVVAHRLAALQRLGLADSATAGALCAAIEALSAAVEELRIASAELQQNNEDLAAAREAAAEASCHYQDLFDFAPDGYLVTDLDGVIQESNQAAKALLGAPEHGRGHGLLLNYIERADLPRFLTDLAELRREHGRLEMELRLRPEHDDPFVAAITVAVMRTGRGTPYGLRWLIRDITQARQTETALRQALEDLRTRDQELQAIMQGTPHVVARFNLDLRCTYASPVAERLTGLAPKDYLGKSLRELGLDENQAAAWDAALRKIFAGEPSQSFPLAMVTPEGARHVDVLLLPERGDDGSIVSVLSVNREPVFV